jgi:hypothetical protein
MQDSIFIDFSESQDDEVVSTIKRLAPLAQRILERPEQSEALFLGAKAIELLMEDLHRLA